MHHDFSNEQWLDYLDGALPEVEREQFESHLRSCPDCACLHHEVRRLDSRLETGGEQLRSGVLVSNARVDRVCEGLFTQPHRTEACDPEMRIRRSTEILRSRLAPMCGAASAERALRLAARRSSGTDLETLTDAQWPSFVSNLASIVTTLCGASPARVVKGALHDLELENVA